MEQGGITESLLTALIRASVGGALFVGIVLCVCRAVPRLPPSVRFGLYCLACVRLLLGIAFALPVPLALADSSWGRALTTLHSPSPAVTRLLLGGNAPAPVPAPPAAPAAATVGPTTALPQVPTNDQTIVNATPATLPRLSRLTLHMALVALWIVGVLAALVAAVRDSFCVRRILRGASALALTGDYSDLVRSLRLRRMPPVRCSSAIATPMVSGIIRPTILVPTGFCENLTQTEQRLAIAHELAHIRRYDLPLNLILTLTRALFFFHPLAHLAIRECAAAREECCDALAVRAAGATAAQYGRFLVGVASAHRASAQSKQVVAATALGMAAASFLPLKRRLTALSFQGSRRAPVGIVYVVTAGAIAGTLPIQFVGATAKLLSDEAALPRYQLIDLGTLGGQSSDATGITDRGTIVGGSNFNPHAIWGHAYAIDASGGAMHDLSAQTRFRRGVAHGANDRGDVVFEAFTHPGRTTALIYNNATRSMNEIPALAGLPFNRPLGINARGDVVGASQSERPDERGAIPTQAFIFRNGKLRQIGTLGGPYSQANAINDAGWVVGKADGTPDESGQSATRAFLARGESLYDLGVLPGGTNSVANAIDSTGRVVGASDTADSVRHAFLVENGTAMRDLGALPDYPSSHALSLANNGIVVGLAYAGDGESTDSRRAVAWQIGMKPGAPVRIVDLNDRIPANTGWTLETARAVNARGQIVGQGMYAGRRRAFLLNPVP